MKGGPLRLRETHLGGQRHVVLGMRHHGIDVESRLFGRGREDRKEPAREAAGAHARPIQVAHALAFQEGPFGSLAAPTHKAEQNVVVAVEDG